MSSFDFIICGYKPTQSVCRITCPVHVPPRGRVRKAIELKIDQQYIVRS